MAATKVGVTLGLADAMSLDAEAEATTNVEDEAKAEALEAE